MKQSRGIRMELEKIAEEIKKYPLMVEYLKPARRGYECPSCGNGAGEDGTGAIVSKDGTRLLCGKCQRGLTNIDVLAFHLGIGTTGEDYREVVKYGAEKLGIEGVMKPKVESEKEKEMEEQIRLDIEEARANLKKLSVKEKRGLTDETLKTFQIGVDFNWEPPRTRAENERKQKKGTPRIIIPHLQNKKLLEMLLSYCAGLLLSERERLEGEGKAYLKYLYGGTRTPFGLNTLKETDKILITEGEWDALSIYQATGGKYVCLATGGTAENGTVEALQKFYPVQKPEIYFVGDNDKAGEKFAEEISAKFRQEGFKAKAIYLADLVAPKTDANKILIEQGDKKLSEMLESLIDAAQKEFEEMERVENQELLGEDTAEYLEMKFEEYIEENKKYVGRKTGFENIDTEMRMFRPGVYVIGGLAALGKTTFALQLLEQMARRGENCIYCSYEMERGFLYAKMLAREVSRLESNNYGKEIKNPLTAVQISQGDLREHEESYKQAVQNFIESKMPLRIWELDEVKVDNLLERLEKICEKVEKPPIVCIDYLQLLSGGNENTKNALDEALRKIFNFRRKTNTTFIIISSLNRMNYNTEISYESFKETGTIEYSADVIWGLQLLLQERTAANVESAKKEIPRKIQLKCLKNRFGSNYDVGFLYYPNADVFLEMEEYGAYTEYRKNESGAMVEVSRSRKKKIY